ncbi:unnamed protein product [Enterobius vermicularis]|uniref:Uncharacterized protein n=1 Tax=Enterobius vermicularis TaxID=51028 RepID=A0A0N4VN86_ENTVE|nr:unnamed protein product [Enterobius vermicularis]
MVSEMVKTVAHFNCCRMKGRLWGAGRGSGEGESEAMRGEEKMY